MAGKNYFLLKPGLPDEFTNFVNILSHKEYLLGLSDYSTNRPQTHREEKGGKKRKKLVRKMVKLAELLIFQIVSFFNLRMQKI